MAERSQRFLIVYSGVLTAVFAITVLTGFAAPQAKKTVLDELDVHRINVLEPDGTLRMVISNGTRLPGVIVRGKEHPRVDRPQAGMLFFNDEGTENGGLIFGGRKNAKGEVVDSGGSLSFDRYGANQIVQLAGVDDKEAHIVGLFVTDSPGGSEENHSRVMVGRSQDGAAKVALMDAKGRKRIVMQVTADGTPSLSFLDADGKVLQETKMK